MYYFPKPPSFSFHQATSWFQTLFPGTGSETELMTKGKLEYRCNKAHTAFLQIRDTVHAVKFLDVNPLDDIDDCLKVLGLSKQILLFSKPDAFSKPHNCQITHEVVVSLHHFTKRERLSPTFSLSWLCALTNFQLSESQMRHRSQQIMKTVNKIRGGKDKLKLNAYMKEPMVIQKQGHVHQSPDPHLLEIKSLNKTVEKCEEKYINASMQIQHLMEEREILVAEKKEMQTEKSLEVEELKSQLKHNLPPKTSRGIQVSDKMEEKVARLEAKLRGKNVEIASLRKNNNSKVESLLALEQQVSTGQSLSFQDKDEIAHLRKERERLLTLVKTLESSLLSLKKKVKSEQTMKSGYKKELDDVKMTAEILLGSEEDKKPVLKANTKNAFSDDVRLTFMALQGEANVSASNCSKVVNIVSKFLYNQEIPMEQLPSIQTALNMSVEGQYLSKYQTVERILSCQHFTLGTDATSRDKRHYVEQHIYLSDGAIMSLGFTEVASDNAETLLEKTVQLFQELSKVYCEVATEAEMQTVYREIISKLKCLMSDRAAVMKLFNKKIAALRNEVVGEDAHTNFLFCNAHFLLGVSSAAEVAVKEIEDGLAENGVKLGRDEDQGAFARFANSTESSVFRLLRTAADVFGPRGDDKSGCRAEWLSYLEGLQVKSRFCSFRTNRFNNIFENASAVIFHRLHIISFLETFVSHHNLKLKSVLMDAKDDNIMEMVNALHMFNLLFSSPYWKLMNSTVPYSEFPRFVKMMQRFLQHSDAAAPVAIPEFDTEQLHFQSEFNIPLERDIFKLTFSTLCSKSLQVLERQLSDFVGDGVFAGNIPQDVLDVLQRCPLTNLVGERLFGDLDFDMSKRRRASLNSRTAINMWKHNRTGAWMRQKKKREAVRLLTLARTKREECRHRSRENERKVREAIRERLEQNKRIKEEKEILERERHLKIVTDVLSQGGLCTTKESIDELMKEKNRVDNLKAQIRYRKVVMNQKSLTLTGNCNDLYNTLVSALSFQTGEPPRKKARKDVPSHSKN